MSSSWSENRSTSAQWGGGGGGVEVGFATPEDPSFV